MTDQIGEQDSQEKSHEGQDPTLAHLQAEVEKLRNQSARYRVARNQALRREHALSTVLRSHNIAFDVGAADLGALSISNGSVSGEFSYSPPKAEKVDPPPPSGDAPSELKLDDLSNMTPEQINARWEDVSAVLSA